ncbi:MAG: multicopper oxidase domain-containing protein [Pseudomonadota bacterium]
MKRLRMSLIIGIAVAIAGLIGGISPGWASRPTTGPGTVPDYYQTPNWALSPPLTKFLDALPGLTSAGANLLGQYIPVAIPDTTTYPGSDYYELEVGQYTEKMHSELPPTRLRGYRQTNTTDASVSQFHYLGPLITATKNRPVRLKFTNALPANGKFFLPVDATIMGSSDFDINYDPQTNAPIANIVGKFSENRADIHLHGGRSAWISDGTPHQWITPKAETTSYPKGASVAYVPDMWFAADGSTIASCAGKTTCTVPGATNNPGPGSQTYFYTNQNSARLMFYHDHTSGITRLNVYAGEAAGYLITDTAEKALLAAGDIPADQIPLIFQDKTFVDPDTIKNTDPTWAWGTKPWNGTPGAEMTPVLGDLWWPHVYMPAQNPYNPDFSGINPMGRWHYGPWFWPPTPLCGSVPDAVPPYCVKVATLPNPYYDPNCDPATSDGFCQPPEIPGTPSPSWGAEAFLDTPLVNGTAYPKLTVDPKAYRFRVLNASHDRFINLQLYLAANKNNPTTPGTGPPVFTGNVADLTEVAMVPASATEGFPSTWPGDGREGGVPDPAKRGPAMIQIGTEGGFLPTPVVLENHPISWNLDPTMFNVGNVLPLAEGGGTLILGPAERADIIVDFSNYAGKTLILYNDAPTAYPALDPHYDYYTGAPDRQDMGANPPVKPGKGPNIRTVMQITVSGTGGSAPVNDYNPATLANLETKFQSGTGVFALSQEPIIVGQAAYNATYNQKFPGTWPYWGISRISDTSLSFLTPNGTQVSQFPITPKAIHDEMGGTFDEYGRMSAKLGLEVPFANAALSTFALQNYVDPPTETTADGAVQIWKFTHNGVDTHPIHFHLFEVQLINRVGWDGFIRLPDANELGWKDTVRMSPLEDTIVALRAIHPRVPFAVPESIRPLNPAIPLGSSEGFSQIDPLTGAPLATPTVNVMHNYGHEFVWHCHILSHEENDMMRPVVFNPNAKSEIIWRNTATGENMIWYMRGTTQLGTKALPTVADLSWTIVATADFNNDGKKDILWRNTSIGKEFSGTNVVLYYDRFDYLKNTDISFSGWDFVPPTVIDQNWTIAGTGDFNKDGKPDIVWNNIEPGTHYTTANAVVYMDGITPTGLDLLPSVASVLPLFNDQDWRIVGIGDFNSDGKPDIIWRNISNGQAYSGQNVLIFMDGIVIKSWTFLPILTDQNWQIVGTGDFNEDVYTDILWRNSRTGENMVWFMNGQTQIGTGSIPTVADRNWTIVN